MEPTTRKGTLRTYYKLQAEFGLSYLVHHYFPPPPEHFVLNLASLDEAIFDSSVAHCREALRVARLLGAEKYGVHAGFLIAVKVSELGRAVARRAPTDADDAVDRFTEAVRSLLSTAAGQVRLYVENNVLTRQNWERYGGFNPFLGTDADSCERLMHDTGCAPLLDLGHLRVSCRSLGRNFEADAVRMLAWTDYLHVSDNNGLADTNRTGDE